MKILIYGSKGWIGRQFLGELQKHPEAVVVEGTSRVHDVPSVQMEIDRVRPTHIVSMIGRTHGKIANRIISTIDYLEEEGKLVENIRDNLYSPVQLAMLCQNAGIHFTYLGTGCIFDYDDDHTTTIGFTEDDFPNFYGSSYSIVKGFTDTLMKNFEKSALNIRIRMPINSESNSRNFITKITKYKKICSIPNSMTVLPELLGKLFQLMKKQVTGCINFTNPGVITHNEILELYRDIVDPFFTWENFTIEEQDQILASKRSNNFLDTSRLESYFPDITPIREAVIAALRKYPKPVHLHIENSKDAKLFITGGCGFIGSNFINHIFYAMDQIQIVNLDALTYCSNVTNIHAGIRNSDRYKFIQADLKHLDTIQTIMSYEQPTHIIHFAAQTHVDNSFENSIIFTHDNVLATHNLLECCRTLKDLRLVVHVSTDEVYGESMIDDDETRMKTEQSVLCPTNPYAATKAGAELIAKAYFFTYKLPIIITRGNNVYGPFQYPEKLIPKFIQLLNHDKKLTIHGDGSNMRAFLHVHDVVHAFELILKKGRVGEIYNIGSDPHMEFSVASVAKLLISLMKPNDDVDSWIEYVPDRLYNDKRYFISNEKVKALGWEITIPFETGIKMLINDENAQ